jgi:hypothetical protein
MQFFRSFVAVALIALASLFSGPVSAGAFTDFAENKLIDFIFRGQASGLPSTWFVALYTTCPTDSSAGTEVTNANGYARVSVGTNALSNWAGTQSAGSTTASSGTSGTTSNNATITFATVTTSSWGTVNCYGLVDSGTYGAGNLWVFSAITVPPTLTVGSTASFAAGALTVQVDN